MADEVIGIDQLTLYDTQLKTYDSTALQMDGTASAGSSKRAARADHVHPTDTSRAPLASPALTGTPTAPTAASGTNTTQIATTAFVQDAIGSLPTGVTGVKGDAESTYRTGNVNITPANIGIADFTGATSSAAGTHGLVPAPASGVTARYLKSNGSWAVPSGDEINCHYDEDGAQTNEMTLNAALSAIESNVEGKQDAFGLQTANTVYAAPNGSAGTPSFRALVAADIPNLSASKITSGALDVARGGTGVSTLGAGVVYHSASGTGALSIATAANIVSALGTTAVNRATADANGNDISTTYATKSEISGAYVYKGSVATSAALPASGQTAGDVYNIEAESTYGPAGTNVAWTGSAWDALGGSFSITYATNAQINALFA